MTTIQAYSLIELKKNLIIIKVSTSKYYLATNFYQEIVIF